MIQIMDVENTYIDKSFNHNENNSTEYTKRIKYQNPPQTADKSR